MMKVIIFGALILCATVLISASCELEKATITRSLFTNFPQSTTVPFKGHLYTVSKYGSHIRINTTDSDVAPCAILGLKSVPKKRLTVTSTDEELFIVMTKSSAIKEGHEQNTYTLLRVHPITCTYQSISIPENNFPTVVKHQKGIDMFFPNLQDCAPCRLTNADLKISSKSIPQFPRETEPPGERIEHNVRFVKSMNAYLYVYNSHNLSKWSETNKFKLIDSNDFKIKKERVIDGSIDAISKQKISGGFLGFCSKTVNRRLPDIVSNTEIRCDRLDSNLNTANSIHIPIDSHTVSEISYEFDDQGNSYISFAEGLNLRLYVHDKNGKLIKAIDMGNVDERFLQHPTKDFEINEPQQLFWVTNGFLVRDEYCISIEQTVYRYTMRVHQVICIDVAKYVKN